MRLNKRIKCQRHCGWLVLHHIEGRREFDSFSKIIWVDDDLNFKSLADTEWWTLETVNGSKVETGDFGELEYSPKDKKLLYIKPEPKKKRFGFW
jgi:hypothetical protein